MECGIHFVDFLPRAPEKLGPTLAAAAKTAEQAGATMFTLADHFLQMEAVGAPAHDPFLEGYTSRVSSPGKRNRSRWVCW
jgi:alkanesulfonate monooxygenase SsuD/methylene tetrahydromethanopterin reductase-like flavin-dependent oxidoreductase (luciferase family)